MMRSTSRSPKSPTPLLVRVAAALLVLAGTASAYIDPGTGSYILQVAIAFLVGLAFSVKVFWKRIVTFLRRTTRGEKKNGGPSDAP